MGKDELDASLTGVYANHCRVGHNREEFVIDFGQYYAQETPVYHTRVVTTPISMDEFVATMQEALEAQRKLMESAKEKPGK